MAKTTNSGGSSNSNNGTNYGGDYGKVHIVYDHPILKNSLPTAIKTPPPPKNNNNAK
ncbi:hypothetical protein [Bacteroides fragilis]|uniref:hypothetical protein n=1 Tax=Bacteroides fragilis TaxID=817 RepID=UPI0013EAD7E9|nr:hypothetical protein [Bacteroides fragilis]